MPTSPILRDAADSHEVWNVERPSRRAGLAVPLSTVQQEQPWAGLGTTCHQGAASADHTTRKKGLGGLWLRTTRMYSNPGKSPEIHEMKNNNKENEDGDGRGGQPF